MLPELEKGGEGRRGIWQRRTGRSRRRTGARVLGTGRRRSTGTGRRQGRGGRGRGTGTGTGEEDGAGVTTEELGGGDGGGGAIFRQPFGSNSRARRNKKICASSGTYIAMD